MTIAAVNEESVTTTATQTLTLIRTMARFLVVFAILLTCMWSLLLVDAEPSHSSAGVVKERFGFITSLVVYFFCTILLVGFRHQQPILTVMVMLHFCVTGFLMGWFIAMEMKTFEKMHQK